MSTQEETIETLARAILNEAREESGQIKADAQEKADAIRRRAQAQAESERKAILDRARQDVERLRSQAVASAQLKARSVQLEHREKLLDKVFEAVKQKLPSLQKRSDFEQIAALLLREALTQLRVNDAEARADEATQKTLDRVLSGISKELDARVTWGDPLKEGVGVIVNADKGRLHYDNTLETRLERLQGALRSSVYHVLMGEKL